MESQQNLHEISNGIFQETPGNPHGCFSRSPSRQLILQQKSSALIHRAGSLSAE
jgi:hypothetical protein